MSAPLIGVVVPVHNAAAFLSDCLARIAGQSWLNFCCVLVDDGSTDSSPALCDAIAACDKRFVVLHQRCCGVSMARANGLRHALWRGADWITFCDADDLYHTQFLETLLTAAQSSGLPVACCQYESFSGQPAPDAAAPDIPQKLLFPRHLDKLLHDHAIDYGMWNKLYRADCIKPEHLDNGYSYNEDLLANWMIFSSVEGVAFCDFAGYHYRQHSDSASHRALAPQSIDDQRNAALYIRKHAAPEIQQSADAFYYEKLVYLASMILRREDIHIYARQLHELCLSIRAGLLVPNMGRNPDLPLSIRGAAWATVYCTKPWRLVCRKLLKDRQ